MLPFLDKKKVAGVIIARKGKPDIQGATPEHIMGDDTDMGMKEAAEDILRAIEQKSAHDLTQALHAFFMLADAMPHVEGDHEEQD